MSAHIDGDHFTSVIYILLCRSSEETPVGPVIGGALGGLVLIIILLLIVVFTTRAVYRCYFAPPKYDEV